MYITINTDAAIDANGVGYYAYWIKGDNHIEKKAGQLKTKPRDSTEAEMMAIVNALHAAIKNREFFKTDIVVFNTDSTGAIHAFEHRKNINTKYSGVRQEFDRTTSSLKQTIKFKHVKGHTKGNTPREHINNWCDEAMSQLSRADVSHRETAKKQIKWKATEVANKNN